MITFAAHFDRHKESGIKLLHLGKPSARNPLPGPHVGVSLFLQIDSCVKRDPKNRVGLKRGAGGLDRNVSLLTLTLVCPGNVTPPCFPAFSMSATIWGEKELGDPQRKLSAAG